MLIKSLSCNASRSPCCFKTCSISAGSTPRMITSDSRTDLTLSPREMDNLSPCWENCSASFFSVPWLRTQAIKRVNRGSVSVELSRLLKMAVPKFPVDAQLRFSPCVKVDRAAHHIPADTVSSSLLLPWSRVEPMQSNRQFADHSDRVKSQKSHVPRLPASQS